MQATQPIDEEALGQHSAGSQTDETTQFGTDIDAAQNGERSLVHGACLIEHRSAFRSERVAVGTTVE